ncbi:hypothetical protein PV325_013547, partial [Microctonus aethiopoides]
SCSKSVRDQYMYYVRRASAPRSFDEQKRSKSVHMKRIWTPFEHFEILKCSYSVRKTFKMKGILTPYTYFRFSKCSHCVSAAFEKPSKKLDFDTVLTLFEHFGILK